MEDEQNKRISRYNPIPAERKAEIIADALERIDSDETLDEIAEAHGITQPTLWRWMMSLGEEYQDKRNALIDRKLTAPADKLEAIYKEIVDSTDPFSLARARAMGEAQEKILRSAQWIAERRDKRYSAKQDVTVDQRQVSFVVVAPLPKEDL